MLLVLTVLALIVLCTVIAIWWRPMVVHLLQWMGVSDSSSRAYNLWSGFGGSVPDFMILASIVTVYRHHSCHVRRCPRLGKAVDGTPYLACPRHHPTHAGHRRGVSVETIHQAHKTRRK